MMRHIRQTSIIAYDAVKLQGIGLKQLTVYNAIDALNRRGIHPTDQEITRHLGLSDPNTVRPRRNELMHRGLVADAGKRTCSVTHRLAHGWRVA